MACRAVVFILLIAHAACGPVETRAVNATIKIMQKEIQTVLHHLDTPGLLPNDISCLSVLNTTELVGPEEQSPTAHRLSFFRCHMDKVSEQTTELSTHLLNISQYSQDLERVRGGQTVQQNCSLPVFEQEMESYVYVKCLLDLLKQQLSHA